MMNNNINYDNHVVVAGDVNADGIDDLVIGAPQADPNGTGSGASYVVFGRTGGFDAAVEVSTLDGANGFALNGTTTGIHLGSAVSGLGDVNGDGVDDLLVGAVGAGSSAVASYWGASYVVFGSSEIFADGFESGDTTAWPF